MAVRQADDLQPKPLAAARSALTQSNMVSSAGAETSKPTFNLVGSTVRYLGASKLGPFWKLKLPLRLSLGVSIAEHRRE